MKKRLDQRVVDLGLAPTKTKAQELIETGAVEIFSREKWSVVAKPSQAISDETLVRLRDNKLLKFVSRSGLKLEACVKKLDISVAGCNALDIGISTGGFSDMLLQAGAASVIGVDVASDQLDKHLAKNSRLTFLPKVNARDLRSVDALRGKVFDLVVIDVSFISIEKILPEAFHFLKSQGIILALIKPQFEVGKRELNKSGVVKTLAATAKALERIQAAAQKIGYTGLQTVESELKGRDGNQEYFLYANKP